MDKKKCQPLTEGAFVRRVTAVSLVLALVLLGLMGIAWMNQDRIYSFVSSQQAGSGSIAAAAKTADKISDEALRQEAHYTLAQRMHQDGAYAEAQARFSALGSYRNSEEMVLSCAYALADGLWQAGDYENALAAFAALGSYSDAVHRQQQILYTMAAKASEEGDLSSAIRLWLSVKDYEDSCDQAFQAALSLTGDAEVATAMLESGGQTQASLDKILAIAQRRALFPQTRIQAGAYHTVVLYSDGTVAAVGDNRYGQCDVEGWKGIVQIAAGAWHTVGLKADGTVVAAGRNDQGQCDVQSMKNISQIAAGDSDTYGLTKEGQVLMTGFHRFDAITRAAQVTGIYAGSYGAAATTATGTLIPSHKSYAGKLQGDILSLGLHTGYLMTHYLDGRLSSSFDIGGDWEDIVSFDAGPTAIIAADLEGRVRAHFFLEGDHPSFSSLENVLQCAAGTSHFVFLTADGELLALGDNTYGQCDLDALAPLS